MNLRALSIINTYTFKSNTFFFPVTKTICVNIIANPKSNVFFFFFLQEPSRLAKCYVIWDDSDFTKIELEEILNYLCHKFSNCNQCVPYPLPMYISHYVAYSSLSYIEKQ